MHQGQGRPGPHSPSRATAASARSGDEPSDQARAAALHPGAVQCGVVAGATPATITVDEASARFPGEWVLMRVTQLDEMGFIHSGQVLYHSPSRREISKHVRARRRSEPAVYLYVFPGGMRRVSAQEWSAHLSRAATEHYVNARW